MRPRAIQGVPGLPDGGTPFGRFTRFAGMIAQVSKAEADSAEKKTEESSKQNGHSQKKGSRNR